MREFPIAPQVPIFIAYGWARRAMRTVLCPIDSVRVVVTRRLRANRSRFPTTPFLDLETKSPASRLDRNSFPIAEQPSGARSKDQYRALVTDWFCWLPTENGTGCAVVLNAHLHGLSLLLRLFAEGTGLSTDVEPVNPDRTRRTNRDDLFKRMAPVPF